MAECQYPPFVREGYRITPYWKNWQVGDKSYEVHTDMMYRCIRACVRLETKIEETADADGGQTPLELGFNGDSLRLEGNPNFEPLPTRLYA
jgi:hypothetical protein